MKRSLRVVLAYPEDQSFGPGGTLAKGVDGHICIITDDVAGSVAAKNEAAAKDFAKTRVATA